MYRGRGYEATDRRPFEGFIHRFIYKDILQNTIDLGCTHLDNLRNAELKGTLGHLS